MYSYDRRQVSATAASQYVDDMDAAYIAQQVIQYGRSSGWSLPTDTMQTHLAQQIEHALSKFNIGIIDPKMSIWGHKPGGSHVFR